VRLWPKAADDAFRQCIGSHSIVGAKRGTAVIAEIEFRKISMQMLFAAMLVSPHMPRVIGQ
jgi:hypothetical protein